MNKETLQEYNTRLSENNTSLDDILMAVNNLPERGTGGGGSSNVYSTEETVIGTWIDGKPLYRKVVIGGTLPATCDEAFYYNVNNVDEIWINESASFLTNSNEMLPINWYYSSTQHMRGWINKGSGSVRLKSPVNLSTFSAYITVEYTKTTD